MGERKPMTVKVDADTKQAFEEFVVDTHGQKYGEMGRAVERALTEYMDNDRLARVESQLAELRQLVESQKEASQKSHAGKSVKERQNAIVSDLITPNRKQVARRDIEEAVRSYNLTSDQTVKKYIRQITDRPVFTTTGTVGVWEVDHDHAEEYY